MRYSTFVYGTGVVYGATVDFTEVLPATGPSTGGTSFVIRGEGFDYTDFDDDFTAGALDGAKWTDISAGTGSVATGADHLQLTTGSTSSSVAGIEMKTTFANTQYECKVNIPTPLSNPVSSVVLFGVFLLSSAIDGIRVAVLMDSTGAITLNMLVAVAGSVAETYSIDWTTGVSVFKILNWLDDTYVYANGSLVFTTKKVPRALDYWTFFSSNEAAAFNIQNVIVEYVKCAPFVMFDNQPVHDATVVGDYRIRGVTPASVDVSGNLEAYKGLVDVSVVAGSTYTDIDAFTYYYLDELTALDESSIDTKISLIGDSTIKTPSNEVKGLGGGK